MLDADDGRLRVEEDEVVDRVSWYMLLRFERVDGGCLRRMFFAVVVRRWTFVRESNEVVEVKRQKQANGWMLISALRVVCALFGPRVGTSCSSIGINGCGRRDSLRCSLPHPISHLHLGHHGSYS